MESKIMQIFYGADCLPYKDQERVVHYPIVGQAFQGASQTTEIHFYIDRIGGNNATWVATAKLPNGKIGSKILDIEEDTELNENYVVLPLSSFYTQAQGNLFISLQGYDGGVEVEYDDETEIYSVVGTPVIQATGSIKIAINYATQFVGSGETDNVNFQSILADLATKLGIRAYTELVNELPTVGQTNIFYAIHNDPNNPNKLNIYVWNGTTQNYVWVGDNTLNLGNYYTQEQGEQFEEQIENRVASVENELSSVASGSPKGVYATLADLQTAYPTGTTGIYIVSADGHWYYWNGSAWADGGVYQATQIADGSVTTAKLGSDVVTNINNIENELHDLATKTYGSYEITSSVTPREAWVNPYYYTLWDIPVDRDNIFKVYCPDIEDGTYSFPYENSSFSSTGQNLSVTFENGYATLDMSNASAAAVYLRLQIQSLTQYYTNNANILYFSKGDMAREIEKNKIFIIVDKNGSGDYTTIQGAIDNATSGSSIFVKSGEYEEAVDFKSKVIHLIGENKLSVVLWNDTGDYDTPPLWACSGSVSNMTIKSINNPNKDYSALTKFSYGIHLDSKYVSAYPKFEINNCIIESDFNDAIGAGAQINGTYIDIHDSFIKTTSLDSSCFKYHTDKNTEVHLKNNIMVIPTTSISYALVFHKTPTENDTGTTTIYANNNSLKNAFGYDATGRSLADSNYGNSVSSLNML